MEDSKIIDLYWERNEKAISATEQNLWLKTELEGLSMPALSLQLQHQNTLQLGFLQIRSKILQNIAVEQFQMFFGQ